jgi:hypothetical protein
MKRSALCLVNTEAQADAIVGKLRSAGFSESDISVLFPDKGSTRDFAHKKETKMPEGATVGASAGGAIGGTIGLLAGIGALAISRPWPLHRRWAYHSGAERRSDRRRGRRTHWSPGRIGYT